MIAGKASPVSGGANTTFSIFLRQLSCFLEPPCYFRIALYNVALGRRAQSLLKALLSVVQPGSC